MYTYNLIHCVNFSLLCSSLSKSVSSTYQACRASTSFLWTGWFTLVFLKENNISLFKIQYITLIYSLRDPTTLQSTYAFTVLHHLSSPLVVVCFLAITALILLRGRHHRQGGMTGTGLRMTGRLPPTPPSPSPLPPPPPFISTQILSLSLNSPALHIQWNVILCAFFVTLASALRITCHKLAPKSLQFPRTFEV